MSTSEIRDTFPVPRDGIDALVGHRNRALELARQAFALLQEAEATAKRAAPGQASSGFLHAVDLRNLMWTDSGDRCYADELMVKVRENIDRSGWCSLQAISGLRNLMDHKAHEKMQEQMRKEVPAFEFDNIMATFMQLAADAPAIFDRSVVTIFESLNTRQFKTNSAFRVGPRVVLNHAMSTGYGTGWNHYGLSRALVGDLDRVMHVLDGKKPPEAGNAADVIGFKHRAESGGAFETEYFEGRTFKNGNLHMKFRRPDLVDKVNRIIAAHYGTTLADDRKAAA